MHHQVPTGSSRGAHGDNDYGILGSETGEWVYSIKVVDCDNKPANKLSTRGEKEELIRIL
jgi:hypothetical protein